MPAGGAIMSSSASSSSPSNRNRIIFKFIFRMIWQSTAFVLLVQFISNVLFDDHDADAFRTLLSPPVSSLDYLVRLFVSGMSRWDGQHYLHIAQYGYTYEHSIAFFPLYPYLIYAITVVWFQFVPSSGWLSFPTALMLSGVLFNVFAFTGAAWFLFALTKNVALASASASTGGGGGDQQQRLAERMAFLAVILFILNPAGVFFRAIYTESLYAFLTFLGMHCLLCSRQKHHRQKPGKNLLESAICFGLALTVRSNGLLNLGYPLYYYGAYWLKPIFAGATSSTSPNNDGRSNALRSARIRQVATMRRHNQHYQHVKEFLSTSPIIALALISALVPFLFAQYRNYQTFCTTAGANAAAAVAQLASKNNYVMPGDLKNLHWCGGATYWWFSPSAFPYTAVQGKYWQVGLFGYYHLRKVPLFILATPTLILALCACVHSLTGMRLSNGDVMSKLLHPQGVLPFVVHVVVLTVVGWLFVNVEVFTRMLFSSSPLPYWYCATLFMDSGKPETTTTTNPGKNARDTKDKSSADDTLDLGRARIDQAIKYLWRKSNAGGKTILVWFLGYTIVGTAAFANFLPWT